MCNDINQLCLDHNISKIAGAFDCLPPSIYFTLGPVCDVNPATKKYHNIEKQGCESPTLTV